MSLVFVVKVKPNAGRSLCMLNKQNRLACFLKNPAERGKANHELITLFAKALHINNDKIKIISGQTSATKMIKIETVYTYEDLLKALNIEMQTSFVQ